ncbi:OsmC-like protein [Enhygromyxa salina]|uniref:OsmC-like protein n=1 Tax=Enhygromyxa salina TaxID=215803 RepID=A0A2S9XDL5_9BACT|nr:OsmC family protein [Enhygromyxa salina]PRP90955.1 OsmC-like protein [Enhygromyxa salina]
MYRALGENQPGGEGRITTLAATIPFDGSRGMGDQVPGPAHLLASALAACVLKNVERFGQLLPFEYERATAQVELERQDRPPQIVRASYRLEVHTEEPLSRCDLLLRNINKFGTISNTLARACPIEATLVAVRSSGAVEELEPGSPVGPKA